MFRNVFRLRRLFDFKGRATRREWLLLHVVWIASFALPIALFAALTGGADPATLSGGSSVAAKVISSLSIFILFAGMPVLLAVAFRRLHDQGNSAWFLLLGAIPIIGWIIMMIMMLYPGQQYDNEYGPDPREEYSTEPELAV